MALTPAGSDPERHRDRPSRRSRSARPSSRPAPRRSTRGVQPSTRRAFAASPIRWSTSAGRSSAGSSRTYSLPVEPDATRRRSRPAPGPSATRRSRPRSRRASAAAACATSPRRSRPRSPSRGGRRGCPSAELLREPELDARDAVGDLARDELAAAARALVVEEDARAREQAVALAVVDGDVVAVDLGDAVRAARVERRRLALRRSRAPCRTSRSSWPGRSAPRAPTSRIASSSRVTPTASNSAVSTGCTHDVGTNDCAARL